MRPLRVLLLVSLLFAAAESIHAAACATASLTVYDAPLFTCTLGPFTLTNFTFTVGPSVGGPPVLTDASVMVSPTNADPSRFGLAFSMTGWSVTSGQKATYTIGYTWDPGPIRSLEEAMSDPPFGAGKTSIATLGCLGGPFPCTFSTTSLSLSDPGTTSSSVSFSTIPDGIMGMQHTITLDVTGGTMIGNTDLTGFGSTVVMPEPGTVVGGLLALALTIAKLRAKRF